MKKLASLLTDLCPPMQNSYGMAQENFNNVMYSVDSGKLPIFTVQRSDEMKTILQVKLQSKEKVGIPEANFI